LGRYVIYNVFVSTVCVKCLEFEGLTQKVVTKLIKDVYVRILLDIREYYLTDGSGRETERNVGCVCRS
jgi:hypothetical protein